MLSYRIFTQDNDRLSIRSLSRILAKDWVHPNARECFEHAKAQLNRHIDSASTIAFPEGHISVRALVDTIIYGGLAHSNEAKAEIFDSWESSGIRGFMWAEFMAYARGGAEDACDRNSSEDVIAGHLGAERAAHDGRANTAAPAVTYWRG